MKPSYRTSIWSRILSWMLAFVMVLSSVPAYASEEGTEGPAPVTNEETVVQGSSEDMPVDPGQEPVGDTENTPQVSEPTATGEIPEVAAEEKPENLPAGEPAGEETPAEPEPVQEPAAGNEAAEEPESNPPAGEPAGEETPAEPEPVQ